MTESLPDFLVQGEVARLFPVLSTTSKEGRTTSILLACLAKVEELGRELLASTGQRTGSRARINTYTEVVPAKHPKDNKDRPDGLIHLQVGNREWKAFVEAKVGANELDVDQIEKYRQLAKENDIDCVVTISNQFSTTPSNHPLEAVRKSRSKVPVVHWSWMHILTVTDLLISREEVADQDQLILLNELRRFLAHESAGVKGFERMPREWSELNKHVSSGGAIPGKSVEASIVIEAWHQECRDLALILSRMTETKVQERLPRAHSADPSARFKDEMAVLRDSNQIAVSLDIPDAAAPVDIVADLARRCIDVGMTLRAPEDKKSTKARLNWLLRQIKSDATDDLYVRINWPGRSPPTQHTAGDLNANVELATEGKEHLAPISFHIFESKRLGGKFAQQTNFISEIEDIVPAFYGNFGSSFVAWKKAAPRIKSDRKSSDNVSTEALSDEADAFDG